MKKNLSTRIKRNLSRIKSLCIFITDVYLSLDSEFIVRVSSSLFLKTSWKHPC